MSAMHLQCQTWQPKWRPYTPCKKMPGHRSPNQLVCLWPTCCCNHLKYTVIINPFDYKLVYSARCQASAHVEFAMMLQCLDLRSTECVSCTGPLPADWAAMPLKYLRLHNNQLTATIPAEWSMCELFDDVLLIHGQSANILSATAT